MRKHFIGSFAASILAVCIGSCALAADIEQKQEYVDLATEVVEMHVYDRDTGSGYTDNDGATQLVNDYLRAKGTYENIPIAEDGIERVDYVFDSNVSDYKIIDDETYIAIAVRVSFQCVGVPERSSYARLFGVIIDNNTDEIIDVYEGLFSSFDAAVRGDDIDITAPENRLTQEDLDAAEERLAEAVEASHIAAELSDAQSAVRRQLFSIDSASGYSYIDHEKYYGTKSV